MVVIWYAIMFAAAFSANAAWHATLKWLSP